MVGVAIVSWGDASGSSAPSPIQPDNPTPKRVAKVVPLEEDSAPASALFIAGSEMLGTNRVAGRALALPPAATVQAPRALPTKAGGYLMGWLSSTAVPSPTDARLLYNAWTEFVTVDRLQSLGAQGIKRGDAVGEPSLRVRDLETGTDAVFEDGAFSVAWRRDGAVAYFKGSQPTFHLGERFVGQILVRDSLESAPTAWTTAADRYIVIAWAEGRLLAYREHLGEQLELVVLDGPGQMRTIAPRAHLVALSPDGQRMLVNSEAKAALLVVETTTGREIGRLDFARDPRMRALSYGGSWSGSTVVAATATGLAVVDVSPAGAISVRKTLDVDPTLYPNGVAEPQFSDAAGKEVVAWASTPIRTRTGPAPKGLKATRVTDYGALDVWCNLDSGSCRRGPTREDPQLHPAYNASRPA